MTPAEFAPAVAAAYPESAERLRRTHARVQDVRYGSAHLDGRRCANWTLTGGGSLRRSASRAGVRLARPTDR